MFSFFLPEHPEIKLSFCSVSFFLFLFGKKKTKYCFTKILSRSKSKIDCFIPLPEGNKHCFICLEIDQRKIQFDLSMP